jgi:hypothetical protein
MARNEDNYSIDSIDHYDRINNIEQTGCRILPHETFRSGCQLAASREGTMERRSAETLRLELVELLQKQAELLNARSLGSASDVEVIDYELRQEVINDICQQLANSSAA